MQLVELFNLVLDPELPESINRHWEITIDPTGGIGEKITRNLKKIVAADIKALRNCR